MGAPIRLLRGKGDTSTYDPAHFSGIRKVAFLGDDDELIIAVNECE